MKCDGLDAEQLGRRSVPPSTLSLLGLVRHLAQMENHWFQRVLQGRTDAPCLYQHEDDPDWDFGGADPDPAVRANARRRAHRANRFNPRAYAAALTSSATPAPRPPSPTTTGGTAQTSVDSPASATAVPAAIGGTTHNSPDGASNRSSCSSPVRVAANQPSRNRSTSGQRVAGRRRRLPSSVPRPTPAAA
ncbi:mycothiol transferase [Micromonospora sediminicola]|uniref:mycothiol transferase n=1 Tax=Micromonospora sediminicola TaxID=946078 RepID=UPI003793275D